MKIFAADISDYGHRWGYPVVSIRLYFGLFIVFPFFLLLAVMAHIRFGWFTPLRQCYLLLGILAGIVGGYIEVHFVTRRLKREVEVVVWVLLPFGLVIWLLPMAYVYLFLDSPEFLPFCTYFFCLPSPSPWLQAVFCFVGLRKGNK